MFLSSTSPIIFPNLKIEWNPGMELDLGFATIRWYGVLIAVGLMLAVVYGCKRCKEFGFSVDDLTDGVLCIVPFAILCARLYYCIFEWEHYQDNLLSVLYIWNGGLAIYGGVIGAVIGIFVFARIKKIKVGAVLDLVALGFLIGQAIGRWGNFFNREAFGAYSDGLLAMQIKDTLHIAADSSAGFREQVELLRQMAVEGGYSGFIQVHPTFLYESVWNVAGFVLLHFLSKKRQYDGQIALGYVAWYGLGRTFIEGLRMDSLYLGSFRVSQLLAAVSCLAAVGVLMYMAFRKHDPARLQVNVAAARQTLQEMPEPAGASGMEPLFPNEEETGEETETEKE
jgi:phosphatidylglycerol:prolipoprotein diacylglycerol transferase